MSIYSCSYPIYAQLKLLCATIQSRDKGCGETSLWLKFMAILSTMAEIADSGSAMKSMSAKDAKNGFGLLIDTARAEPVMIEKHGRPVVVVVSIEEYERLRHEADSRVKGSQTTQKK